MNTNICLLLLTLLSIAMAQETFVLVHGSSLGAWYWFKIKPRLEEKGHTVITLDLPSLGIDSTDVLTVTLQDHINAVLDILDNLSQPAIVVGHSYGGVLLSAVSELRPSKVKKAVFYNALMLQSGESLYSALLRDTGSLILQNVVSVTDPNGVPLTMILRPEAVEQVFCADCSKQDLTLLKSLLVPHPAITYVTPITIGTGFASVPKYYIEALNDNTLSPAFQEDMYSKFPDTKVYKVEASHLSLLSKPVNVAAILLKIAKE